MDLIIWLKNWVLCSEELELVLAVREMVLVCLVATTWCSYPFRLVVVLLTAQ